MKNQQEENEIENKIKEDEKLKEDIENKIKEDEILKKEEELEKDKKLKKELENQIKKKIEKSLINKEKVKRLGNEYLEKTKETTNKTKLLNNIKKGNTISFKPKENLEDIKKEMEKYKEYIEYDKDGKAKMKKNFPGDKFELLNLTDKYNKLKN